MVMEAPPSPQSVGREFVRQYYTLLNKAPTHLHRFYNHQSSFIHGGLDPNREVMPVIGQKQIHQKIQQLNFRDCHAKITQVDSQSTLGGGVVVQVTGELSNAGQPMRRFTQTFVLASQSPKKYYVHNDIFRYQDEIINDEDCEGNVRCEIQDCPPLTESQQELVKPIATEPGLPFYGTSLPPTCSTMESLDVQQATKTLLYQGSQVLPAQPATITLSTQPPGSSNGRTDDFVILSGVEGQTQELSSEDFQEELAVDPIIDDGGYRDITEEEISHKSGIYISNEPKTYANLLKNCSGQNQSLYQSQTSAYPYRSLPLENTTHENGTSNRMSAPKASGVLQSKISNLSHVKGTKMGDDDERKRSQAYNFGQLDANQLFLGNLPHSATEDELKEIFAEYGTVLDLRVHSKPNPGGLKTHQGRTPPNYGFITYESQQSVVTCLAAKPIYYPRHDNNGTMLNVEEKKIKDRDGRPSYGSSGGRSGLDSTRSGRGDGTKRGMGLGGPRGTSGSQGAGDRGKATDNRYNRTSGPLTRGGSSNYSRR